MKLLLLIVAAFLAGAVLADICPGVATVPGGQCSEIWFACVQTGTPFLNEVDIEFGEKQNNQIVPWTIAKSGWGVSAGVPVNNIALFYADGVPTKPMNGGSNNIGQGQWACTKDGQFQAASPQSSNDFGTGSVAINVDLFRRNSYLGWGLRGIGSNTPGGSACLTNTLTALPRLNSVPASSPTCNPSTGSLVSTITDQMTFLGSCASMNCYAASFDPCQCNGCPPGYVRVGPNSDCCPAGAVVVGDGTAGNPTRCCPAGQSAVKVPGSTNYICCPTGQVSTRGGQCCPQANYVSGNPDACCPFANPACQSGSCTVYQFCQTPPCTTRELCCPQSNVNKPLGTANPICCPSAATNDGCNFRKRLQHQSGRFHADCSGTPQWQQTADGTLCCPPARASENNQYCCPNDPPTGQWFVTVGNNNCCPSGQVAANGQYCCPGSSAGTVSVPEGDASTVPQCCPSSNVASVGPGNDYCCPSAPPSGQQWCRAASGASGTNINCCPCSQVSGGTGSASYCCPSPPPSGQSWTQTAGCDAGSPVDCKCCPSSRRNADGSYCCPSAPPSGQTWVPTTGCAAGCGTTQQCCPSSQVVSGYCCPATGGPFTRTQDEQCCPTSRVATPPNGATSSLRCCPASGGPFQVTSNNDCCPVNRVSCQGGTSSCSQSQAYCCPSAESSSNPFWYLQNGDQTTTPECCPADQVSANTNNKYCCPTGSATPQYWDGTSCCPESEWDGTKCCPGGNAVDTPGCSSTPCDSSSFSRSCSSNTPPISCCNSDSTQARCCPAGSRWTGSGCCPANNVALSNPLTNKASSVCCPSSGSVLTINNECCPQANVGTCGTSAEYCDAGRSASDNKGPICCPSAGQRVADVVLFCTWDAGSCSRSSCDESYSNRCSAVSTAPFTQATAANYCCPPANTLVLDCDAANPSASQTCSNNIVCCPNAVSQSSTIVARASWNPAVQVCCPAANVVTSGGSVPTASAQCGYSNYDSSSLTCCPAAVTGTYVWTRNLACCPTARALTGSGNSACPYCCPASSPCITQNLGCTCDNTCFNFRASTANTGATNYAECYPCDVIVQPPGGGGDILCLDSTYWAQYGYGTSYEYTTNEPCCPTELVTESPPGSGTFVCCPTGQVGAPNLAAVGITSGCCPAADAVSIPPEYQAQFNGAVNWCCPSTVKPGNCAACKSGVTASSSASCTDQIFCTQSCAVAWDSTNVGFAVPQTLPSNSPCSGSANNVATLNSGCCPTNRLSDTGLCCPDASWLPAGATWVSGLRRYDGTWFPNNCCPSTWQQKDERETDGLGDVCCPAANSYYTNWATGNNAALQNCCPSTQRVLPEGYAAMTPSQKAALGSSTGVWCCPDPAATTDVCTTAGSKSVVASSAGGWGWYFGSSCGSNTNYRCCPLNYLLGPSGPVSGAGASDKFTDRLCCPSDASQFTYINQGGQRLCCPTSGATVTPINTPGEPKCCPTICQGGCPSNVWWSQKYTAPASLGAYDCCPTEPESAALVRTGAPAPPSSAAEEELNICCPVVNGQPGRRTGCDSSCPSGDQGVTYCCPANQVLSLPTRVNQWDWRNARCCPTPVTDPGTKWVRQWSGSANSGSFVCCPPAQQNTWQGADYCCPNPSDVSTAQSACCPAANVINDPVDGPQCCPDAAVPGTLWLQPAKQGGQTLGTANVCCPPDWQNEDDSACCPVSLFPTCGSATTTCKSIDSTPPNYCCIPTNVNNAGTACCPGPNREDTDNDDCCPSAQAEDYDFGLGNAGSLCCPTSVADPVIVNDQGTPKCCPRDQVLNDGGVLRCCPESLTQGGLTPADWVWVEIEATGQPGCCPKPNLNGAVTSSLPAGTVCCPDTGSTHTTDDPCCPDYAIVSTLPAPNDKYVACCPEAESQVVNTADFSDVECCPSVRVVDDGSGVVCCPDGRWNEEDQSCCPVDQTAVGAIDGSFVACCPDVSLTSDGGVCCLPGWWDGTDVSLDSTGACCPSTVLAVTGECCDAAEKDYQGVCCPSEAQWGLSYDRKGVLQNRSCCVNIDTDGNRIDCQGFCLPPDGQPVVYYTDPNDICCPYDELDCAGFCPLASGGGGANGTSGTPVLNNTLGPDGKCCPPDARDCRGDCYGYDLNCCSVINNCTGCIASDGCGWCGAPGGGASARCSSGDFFGATGHDGYILPFDDPQACTGETWIYLAKSTIQMQTGRFSQPGDPVVNNLEWTLQRVVLAPNQPLVVSISVRSPENIPLDLFFLQDVTASFENDMTTVNATINQFLDSITNVVADTWFGWGSFLDKPITPFGEYIPGLPSRQDYVVKIDAQLSPSKSAIARIYDQYAALNLIGGADIPEASLEAMLAISDITGTVRDVGWRADVNPDGTDRRVNRVALIITDAPPHQDGDVAKSIAIRSPTNPTQSAFPNLEPLNGWPVNNLDPWQDVGSRETAPNSGDPPQTLAGLGEKYPNMQDVADIWAAAKIFPVFLVAPTDDPDGVYQPTDAKTNFTLMASMFPSGRAIVTDLSSDSSNLEAAVVSALETVTQTISLIQRIEDGAAGSPFIDYTYGIQGILADPNNPPQASPGTILNYTVRLLWDGTPACEPGQTTFCVPQPHTIPFDAIFPIQGTTFETGGVEVIVGQPQTCGFCADRVWQPWLGEQCDPLVPTLVLPDGSPNPCCTITCEWGAGVTCDASNLCAPRVCAADGTCITDDALINNCDSEIRTSNDPQGLCSTFTCQPYSGECVWACMDGDLTGMPCCDDNNNCTIDYCVNGECQHRLDPLCDCASQINCGGCVDMNATCVWDNLLGLCYTDNISLNLTWQPGPDAPAPDKDQQREWKALSERYAWTPSMVQGLCVGHAKKPVSAGTIVGAVIGAALAAAACMALGAALLIVAILARAQGKTLGNQFGLGYDPQMDLADDNPLYKGAGAGNNPLFDAN